MMAASLSTVAVQSAVLLTMCRVSTPLELSTNLREISLREDLF